VTTKTEQNNGIMMFNTSNEGTGGLGISSFYVRILWDFSCYVQSLYSLPYGNIVFNDKVC
jgi:hypothetical protein